MTPFLGPLATAWPFCSPIAAVGDEILEVENDATVLPGFYHFMQTTRAGGRDSRRSCRAVVGDFPESDSDKVWGSTECNADWTDVTPDGQHPLLSRPDNKDRHAGSRANLNAR